MKKKTLINLSSPHLKHTKASNFTTGRVQYYARQETGDTAVGL